MTSKFLAVDVGASRLKIGVFEGLNIVRRVELETPKTGGPLAVARTIVDNVGFEKFESVGVASIGPLDLERGWVVNTPNNPLKTFALRDPLSEAFKAPVIVANDCMAAAWGEHVLGGGVGVGDLAYITISTGVGVGVVVDGRLLVGRRGNAHEAGHIVVDVDSGVRCGCGGLGHWEALASGANIPRIASIKAGEWGGDSDAWRLALGGSLSPEALYAMARAGDPFAVRLVDYINRVHASGIASVIAAYDPEVIFVGGSIYLNNEDLMVEGILKYIREYSLLEPPPIRRATFGDDSVLYGALAIALNPPRELTRYFKGA
ncbi:MAG: ROK family protein [Thermoprotei archaeon]|nr:ROK family protein [Thermoprotei archaeon]